MKKVSLLMLVLVSAIVLLLTACGGGGGGGAGTGGGGGTPITNTNQASQAASTGTQAVNMAQGSGDFVNNFSDLSSLVGGAAPKFRFPSAFYQDAGLAKAKRLSAKLVKSKALMKAGSVLKKAMSMKATGQISGSQGCTDGGSYDYSGTVDNITFTFNNCREDGFQMNGPLTMTGSWSETGGSMTLTFGASQTPFTMLEFANNYATLVSKMTLDNLSNSMTLSQSGLTQTLSSTMMSSTMNGDVSIHDYLANEDYSMQFNNYRMDMSGTCTDQYCNDYSTLDVTVNGGFTETWNNGQNSVALTYSNFRLTETYAQTYEEWSVDGTASVDFTPDGCFEGDYVFVTLEPFRVENGQTVSGHMTINTNTHIEVRSAGTFTVWYDANGNGSMDSGEKITETNDLSEIAEVCDFYTFNEEVPVPSGTGGTATGDTMTITLTWTGGDTSDMDLHLNYYNTTTPTSTTQGAWYVDYHGMDSCANGYSGVNLDNDTDGICEVYLDFDDTEGYGPEHITATQLPSGYYVVSVNSFDLDQDPSATVSVTIQIGDTIFGPYTHTFTTYDFEDHDLNAWFAVADIVVDSSGNATVKDHDPDLELWHDGAFGLLAPKKAKGLRR